MRGGRRMPRVECVFRRRTVKIQTRPQELTMHNHTAGIERSRIELYHASGAPHDTGTAHQRLPRAPDVAATH